MLTYVSAKFYLIAMAYAFSEKSIDVYKQHSLVIGKRVLVHSPSNLCWTWHSINDAKDERIPKVNVPEQSSQSMSFRFLCSKSVIYIMFRGVINGKAGKAAALSNFQIR